MASGSKFWSVFSMGAAIGAAAATRKVLDRSWRATTGRKPPENPADPDVKLAEAVTWAVVTGAAVALARMLAQRRAADYYLRSTGHLPAELQKDGQ